MGLSSKTQSGKGPAMKPQTHKVLESLSGSGVLHKAGKHLAKVFYHLQVRQITSIDETTSTSTGATGTIEIVGEVTVSQDEPNQAQVQTGMSSGEKLALHLADGRRLDVHAAKADALTGTYQVVGDSPAVFRSE
jgi:arginine/lysine/ornithine decarboxylase